MLEIEDLEFPPESVHLCDLPDEIILRIFAQLSTSEILQSLALVCKKFSRICRDASVISHIYLKPNLDNSQQLSITNAISRSRCLKSLTLKGRSDAEHLVSTACSFCPKLETLQIIHCPKLSDDCLALLAESELCASLKNLNLECTPISTHWGTSQIMKLPNLTSLNLFNSRLFDSEHLKALAYSCEKLEHLNIEEVTHLSEDAMITLIQERKDTLKTLYVDGESLSDQTFKHLFLCQNLQELGISFAEEMGENGIYAISQLHQLRILKLKRAKKVKSDDFVTLFARKNLASLHCLDLSECVQVSDDVIKTLALECPKLDKVMLNWCWEIRDEGLEFLTRYANEISHLFLVGVVLITDVFLRDLLENLPKLVHLDLQQCPNVTDRKLENLVLKSENYQLQIVNYYGEIIQPEVPENLVKAEVNSDSSDSSSLSSATEGADSSAPSEGN